VEDDQADQDPEQEQEKDAAPVHPSDCSTVALNDCFSEAEAISSAIAASRLR
jgi:hypothetical protein